MAKISNYSENGNNKKNLYVTKNGCPGTTYWARRLF